VDDEKERGDHSGSMLITLTCKYLRAQRDRKNKIKTSDGISATTKKNSLQSAVDQGKKRVNDPRRA
jgi:hypothetical protein